MKDYKKHIIHKGENVRSALIQLDKLASDAVLFVTDNKRLIGAITDGDIRRGFIKGLGFEDSITLYMNPKPKYILENEISIEQLDKFRKQLIDIVPILNSAGEIIDIINFQHQSTILPVDAIIMAGGKGQRLMPLTATTPKPLLKIGEKPIIEYNIDRLINVGIKNITLSINYLGEQLVNYFQDGTSKGIHIDYIKENKPMGTIGSILLKEDFKNDDILVMNSDLLTNIDFVDFFKVYKNSAADMGVATISYKVNIPYGVLETDESNKVISLREKPDYTYFSNAGIYIINKRLLSMIPNDTFFNVTDLMQKVMDMDNKLITYSINGYWLDIGKHEDFKKAQEDIKHIKL